MCRVPGRQGIVCGAKRVRVCVVLAISDGPNEAIRELDCSASDDAAHILCS